MVTVALALGVLAALDWLAAAFGYLAAGAARRR